MICVLCETNLVLQNAAKHLHFTKCLGSTTRVIHRCWWSCMCGSGKARASGRNGYCMGLSAFVLSFWKAQLSTAPTLVLPFFRFRLRQQRCRWLSAPPPPKKNKRSWVLPNDMHAVCCLCSVLFCSTWNGMPEPCLALTCCLVSWNALFEMPCH